jgi:hypothetical protein
MVAQIYFGYLPFNFRILLFSSILLFGIWELERWQTRRKNPASEPANPEPEHH